jgi:hypothetical protein
VVAAVDVGIGNTPGIERARGILLEIAKAHPELTVAASCRNVELGSSSVTPGMNADAAISRS